MLAKVQSLVKSMLESADQPADKTRNLQLAAAALLVEVSAADFERHPEERRAIFDALSKVFELDHATVKSLVDGADHLVHTATSLYEFTRVLNDHCTHQEKLYLIEQCWRVAFADGHLDKYEDHRIRKLSDLLYIPHREFIQTKLKVQPH
jgi:uncharacterized tellurite resistance protein B-like protein